MEAKSLLFKFLGDVDVVPFCITPSSKIEDEIELIKTTISNFLAVNLEDIKSPNCFLV